MWIRRTLQVVLGGYLAYFVFLTLTIYCLPLTINDMLPLPFEVPVISPHRLGLNVSTVLLMLLILVFCREYKRMRRLFAIGRKSQPMAEFNSANASLSPGTPGMILVLLIAVIGAPVYIVLQNRDKTAEAKVLDDLEQEFRTRIQKVAQEPTRIQTRPSPDRSWDSLPYTKLPVLELELPQFSQFELNKALPRWKDGFNSDMAFSIFSKGTEYWPYVPAFFTYADTRYPVDVRYRGWNFDHYLGFKKSWRIKFRKDDLFFGRRQFNIINQRDHTAVNDILWSEALRESGIMVPFQFLVHYRVNGEYQGIQTFLEQPDRYFAERHNRNASDIFGEQKPIIRTKGFFDPKNWQQYASAGLTNNLQPLLDLYRIALDKDHPDYVERIENSLDVDHYLKYLAHATITCSENPSTHNIRWIRDPGVGRFQILPWYQASSTFIIEGHRELLEKKGWNMHPPLLAINDFADGLFRLARYREIYLRNLWRMLQSTHHHEHIQRKIDELIAYVRSDVHADTHMHYRFDMARYVSNAEWNDAVDKLRSMIDDRLQFLERTFEGGPIAVVWRSQSEPIQFPGGLHSLGALEITSTNYCAVQPISIRLKTSKELDGVRLSLLHVRPGQTPVKVATAGCTNGLVNFSVTSAPSSKLLAAFERTPIPMGPGIIVDGLGAEKNPDIEFIGGVSQLAPWYQPKSGTNRLFVCASKARTSTSWSLESVTALNSITGRKLGVRLADRFTVGESIVRPKYDTNTTSTLQSLPYPNPRTPEQTMDFVQPDGVSLGDHFPHGKLIQLPPGTHDITTNMIVKAGEILFLGKNTVLRFAPGKSLIIRGMINARGTTFTSVDPKGHWGVVFVNPNRHSSALFRDCTFERSANVTINGMAVTAGLAAYSGECRVLNCRFQDMAADDAFNSKYVSPHIFGCTFSNNLDAIDIDMGGGLVTACRFVNNRDDCIDLSSSWAMIESNIIHSHGDKGISVGEKSQPKIYNNLITDAAMGIAVKDLSNAIIVNNTIATNQIAIALYEKKSSFGPGTALVVNNLLFHNQFVIDTKHDSKVTARFNAAPTPLHGEGNIASNDSATLQQAGSCKRATFYGITNRSVTLRHIGATPPPPPSTLQ